MTARHLLRSFLHCFGTFSLAAVLALPSNLPATEQTAHAAPPANKSSAETVRTGYGSLPTTFIMNAGHSLMPMCAMKYAAVLGAYFSRRKASRWHSRLPIMHPLRYTPFSQRHNVSSQPLIQHRKPVSLCASVSTAQTRSLYSAALISYPVLLTFSLATTRRNGIPTSQLI